MQITTPVGCSVERLPRIPRTATHTGRPEANKQLHKFAVITAAAVVAIRPLHRHRYFVCASDKKR